VTGCSAILAAVSGSSGSSRGVLVPSMSERSVSPVVISNAGAASVSMKRS
jgi:hypothetical protein